MVPTSEEISGEFENSYDPRPQDGQLLFQTLV